MTSEHEREMDKLRSEISELQETERRQQQDEKRAAEERQRLVTTLETDLQQILDDKKAELKVRLTVQLSIMCNWIPYEVSEASVQYRIVNPLIVYMYSQCANLITATKQTI